MRRRALLQGVGAMIGGAVAAPALVRAAASSTLRFIPQQDLVTLDPVTTFAYITRNHGYMVFDTLYGMDGATRATPQMVEGHRIEEDGRRWDLILREGLLFHDGAHVLARDCVASIRRWARRDPFGESLMAATDELSAPDDRTIRFRLKRPFPWLPIALGKASVPVCAMMPERLAATDPFQQVPELVGSGPFRFKADERVPGDRAVYTRFEGYVPRKDGMLTWTSGPKVVHYDRVEWRSIADTSTATAALTNGEADWLEYAYHDQLPLLRAARGVTTRVLDRTGFVTMLKVNHLQPPFDNPGIRRAVMMAMRQDDYMQAVVGSPEYYRQAKTFFTPGSPMSTGAGGEAAMQGDLAKAKAMLKEAGYKGEKVVLLAAADQPIAYNQSLVTQDLLQKLGMTVDLVSTDWGSFIGRRGNRGTPDQGGWSVFHTLWSGADTLNPALHPLIRANGATAWFGWPEDKTLEGLRDAWIATDDAARQKALAAQIEEHAFAVVPYAPAGLVQQPMAYRSNLKGMVMSPVQFFWNMEKV